VTGRIQLDVRLVGAGVLAAATALTVLLVTRPADTTDVLVASAAVPSGVPLSELELEARAVRDATGLVVAGDVDGAEYTLALPLDQGTPIAASLLVPIESADELDLVGLSLDSAAAVHGWITPGDRVDVYTSVDEEGVALVAESVPVVMVEADSGALASADVRVVLAIEPQESGALIASADGDIRLVRRSA